MTTASRLTLDRLRQDGQAFSEEYTREYYLAASGQKPTAELQPIFGKYRHITSEDSLALTLDAFKSAAEGSEERRQARLLLEWQAESQSSRQLAALDEREIAWEASAMVTLVDGQKVQYEQTAIEIANSGDRQYRLAVEDARARLVAAELDPIRRERFQRERDITEALDLADSYNATWELLTGIALVDLRRECEQFLRDTQSAWDETFPEFVRRGLNIEPGEARRSDAMALLRAREFDAFFPAGNMETQVHRHVSDMAIDPTAHGRIHLDTGERDGKRSRAFCAPVRVPEEVYLVLRPHGGQTDWSTFLHELGHALHFAYMRADHPFEYRWLGDNSITESYAMLFDHRLQDAGWLKRYTDLGAARVQPFLRSAGFEELHFLRRYCAKLIYETHLYGGAIPWSSLPDLYVQLLTDATTFQYNPADAFVDVDPRYYAARYLRAWQLQALLNETLTERYNEDWWRNPRVGPWMVEQLFAEGQRETADEQALRVAGRPLSFTPLVREIERLLA